MSLSQSLGDLLRQHMDNQGWIPAGIPADKKVTTIKNLREVTSLGLKEAKDFVEAIMYVTPENIGDMARIIANICADMRFQIPMQERIFLKALYKSKSYSYPEIVPLCEKTFGKSIDQNRARYEYLDWYINSHG